MDNSRKVILVSCLSMAFLAGIFACSVEDINLEKKDLFVCKAEPGCMVTQTSADSQLKLGTCQIRKQWEDMNPSGTCLECAATSKNSCLSGSYCIAVDPDNLLGRCVAEDDIEHCHDFDNDTYYGADPGFESNCGFTQSMPKDCDDSNPDINAKATEVCDGVDNTCDGCIDGICPVTGCNESGELAEKGTYPCDCDSHVDYCEPLVELCIGAGSASNMLRVDKAVCRPDIAGVNYCSPETGKQWEYRVLVNGNYEKRPGQQCPKEGEAFSYNGSQLYFTYDEVSSSAGNNKDYCNGFDSDCNGTVDCIGEKDCGCPQRCDPNADTNDTCYVQTSGSAVLFNLATEKNNNSMKYLTYSSLYSDPELSAICTGVVGCPANNEGKKICKDADGNEMKANSKCNPKVEE